MVIGIGLSKSPGQVLHTPPFAMEILVGLDHLSGQVANSLYAGPISIHLSLERGIPIGSQHYIDKGGIHLSLSESL